MNIKQFTATSIALLRTAVGWQSAIARRLGVDSRTVRRWVKAGEAPAWVDDKFTEMLGATDIAPWPRDEWLIGEAIGDDGRRREYISHLHPPRFVARIAECNDDGLPINNEDPVDVLSGIVYMSSENTALCEIDWIETVSPGEYVKWLEAAADALDNFDT